MNSAAAPSESFEPHSPAVDETRAQPRRAGEKTNRIGSRSMRFERWAPALLFASAAVLYLLRLGKAGLFDPAEGMYAEIPREMILLKDWLTPHFDFVRYFEKPPLIYWLNAAAFKIFGFSEFAARLPTALAALAGVFLVYTIGRDLWGRRAGLISGTILATSFGWFIFGRLNLPDMLFTAFVTGAFYGFGRGLLGAMPRPGAILIGYIAMAGAMMTKGLIGVVFPVLTLGTFILLSRDWQLIRRLQLVRGGALLLLLTIPWHVLMEWKNPGFLWLFFINEHVSRFVGSRTPDYAPLPLTTYLILTAVWFCPWIVFLPAALRRSCRRGPDGQIDRGMQFVLGWAGAIIGFFAVSPSRLEYYALPAVPALALCVGRLWDTEISSAHENTRSNRLLPAWIALILFSLCLIPAAELFPRLEHMKFYNLFPFAESPPAAARDPALAAAKIYVVPPFADLVPLFKTVVALIVGGTAVSALAWFGRRPGFAFAFLVVTLGAGLAAVERGFVKFAPHRSVAELGRFVCREFKPGDQLLVEGKYENHASIVFYSGRPARVYRGDSGDLYFGSTHYPDCRDVFVAENEFQRLWRGPARVFLLSDAPDCLARLRALDPGTIVLGRTGSNWLFANRPVTTP